MSKRIAIRDKFMELVRELPGLSNNVALYKLDIVERFPFASVYLAEMSTENLTMMRQFATMDRNLSLGVDIHLDGEGDADADLDTLLESLESKVIKAALNGDIPGVREIYLENAEFRPTQRGREKAGDLVTSWRAEYEDSVSLS